MAEVASALEVELRRANEAQVRDALRIQQQVHSSPAIDPSTLGIPATSAVDAAQTSGAQALPNQARQGSAGEQQGGVASSTLSRAWQLRTQARQAAAGKPSDLAATVVNTAYTRAVSAFQSELIANVLGLEVFVSPWLFLLIFFLRSLSNLLPIQVRGVRLIPPYTFRTLAGIGEFISHLAAAIVILIVLLIILLLISFIAWFLTASLWTKVKVIADLGGGALKVLCERVTGSACTVFN